MSYTEAFVCCFVTVFVSLAVCYVADCWRNKR
jgi:hypothetical protein